jgi:hypothetical protein
MCFKRPLLRLRAEEGEGRRPYLCGLPGWKGRGASNFASAALRGRRREEGKGGERGSFASEGAPGTRRRRPCTTPREKTEGKEREGRGERGGEEEAEGEVKSVRAAGKWEQRGHTLGSVAMTVRAFRARSTEVGAAAALRQSAVCAR